jgi:hypothetical protein
VDLSKPVPLLEQGENDEIKQWELKVVNHKALTKT